MKRTIAHYKNLSLVSVFRSCSTPTTFLALLSLAILFSSVALFSPGCGGGENSNGGGLINGPMHDPFIPDLLGDGIIQTGEDCDDGNTVSGDCCSSNCKSEVIKITAGESHTCVIMTAGAVKCWGRNNFGQLGDGTTTDRSEPVEVSGLSSGAIEITAGESHTCALTEAGGVKCWGLNSSGQLGDGTKTEKNVPTNVSELTSGAVSISAGGEHTCSLMDDGGVKCWGISYNGTITKKTTPEAVPGITGDAAEISAGYDYTCALMTSGGVKCWGRNYIGQLGDGTIDDRSDPDYVSGLDSGVKAISSGFNHACALMAAGDVKCWGRNNFGQLGDGTNTDRLQPIIVSGLASDLTAISAGSVHTCALTSSGKIICWGRNYSGQLGDGTTTDRYEPVDVSELSNGGQEIWSGGLHTCALTSSDELKCWGRNYYGQLGDGTTTDRNIPTDVSGLTN